MQRNISQVIGKIREQIPKEKLQFLDRLDWILKDATYRPPEDQGVSWQHLHKAVTNYCPFPPQEEWQWKIASILTTKTVEKLKLENSTK